MIAFRPLVMALCAVTVSAPALGQDTWLPTDPPAGLALRVWLTGPEPATVDLAIRFADEPWCMISGRFSPQHHTSSTGYVAAATPCGLAEGPRDRVLGTDGIAAVQLKGIVRLASGAVLTVSETTATDLADVLDATIDLSGGRIAFDAVKG